MRHKYLATLKYDWYPWGGEFSSKSIFTQMQEDGYVEREYEYSTKDRNIAGKVFVVTEGKAKYSAIATNSIIKYSIRRSFSRRKRYVVKRCMFLLNEKGTDYIKGLLVEQSI